MFFSLTFWRVNPTQGEVCWEKKNGLITGALRNEKNSAKRSEEKGPRLLQLWSFLLWTFSRSGPPAVPIAPPPPPASPTLPLGEPALIGHAEGLSGEEGQRFSGKAELERGARS